MSHKKIISLANRFFIKLAYEDVATNPGDMPNKEKKTVDTGINEPINDLLEPPSALIEMVHNNPYQDERMSSPGEGAIAERREIVEKLYGYAKTISNEINSDFGVLKDYWLTHQKEYKALDNIKKVFDELLPIIIYTPYEFKTKLTDFLNSKPELKLYNPANSVQPISETQMDNLKTIYYDSYSDMIFRHTNRGLSGGQVLKPAHPKGIRMLMMLPFWMEENM